MTQLTRLGALDTLRERMTNPFIVHEISHDAWLWEELADRSLRGHREAALWDDDRNWPLVRAAFLGTSWLVRTFYAPLVRARKRAALRARGTFSRHDFRRMLDHLEARAPLAGYWVAASITVADIAIFAQLDPLRSSLTPWHTREIKLRPALTDWLDRVEEQTSYAA